MILTDNHYKSYLIDGFLKCPHIFSSPFKKIKLIGGVLMSKSKNNARFTYSWKIIFIAMVCIFSLLISVWSLILYSRQEKSFKSMESYIEQCMSKTDEKDEAILKSNAYIEFCETIQNKTDSSFNQLITIVGIFASIITLLGVLITFKAPKDIEKEIEILRQLTDKNHKLVEEQEYLLQVFDAVKEETIYHRIRELTKVINEHPDKWQAYLYRGTEYDDNKKYDEAIKDYKRAKQLGCSDETYFNNMAISISNRYATTNNPMDRELSLKYISKAIEINSEEPVYYLNRGVIYSELKKYDLAEIDFDTAISIDPENYEVYSSKASLYIDASKDLNNENGEKYKEMAIEAIKKALDLNAEDKYNLKRLLSLLREKFVESDEIETQEPREEIVGALSFRIDERLGDISFENEDYVDAITHYTDALTIYNTPSFDTIKNNIITIEKLCEKIRNCREKMPSIDVTESINRKLNLLIIVIGQIGFEYYQQNEFEKSGQYFEYAVTLSGFGNSYSNNLAYMIRRKEFICNKFNVTELLACKTPDDSSAFLRINRALCTLTKCGYEYDIKKVLQEINTCENELDDALAWWSNEDVVGPSESNVVLFLLAIMKKIEISEDFDINIMLTQAISDGYDFPININDIANEILQNEDDA